MNTQVDIYDQYLLRFAKKCSSSENLEDLHSLIHDFMDMFGFIHIKSALFEADSIVRPTDIIFGYAYPVDEGSWHRFYMDNKLYELDRTVIAPYETRKEILEWSEVERRVRHGTTGHQVFDYMREFGIGNGYVITHASSISQRSYFVSFGGTSAQVKAFKAIPQHKAALQLMLQLAHRYIDVSYNAGHPPRDREPYVEYSQSMLDVVKLLSVDMTVVQIAEKLNRKPSSIKDVIKRLKLKTGQKTLQGVVGHAARNKKI